VSGRSRAESQVGVRLMGVWRVSYSNIQEIFILCAYALLLYVLMAGCSCLLYNNNKGGKGVKVSFVIGCI
jgi:hypothetical protein